MANLIATHKGFDLRQPTSGGKAGKGNNKTSTIQVYKQGIYIRVKQFVYNIGTDTQHDTRYLAIQRAKDFIDKHYEALSAVKTGVELIEVLEAINKTK